MSPKAKINIILEDCAQRRVSKEHVLISQMHLYSKQTHPSLPETTPILWKASSVSKMTPPFAQTINKYTQRSSLFHLINFECTASPVPYIHALSYMPPHNQISIWCQGGLRFGVFSFVNTTCQLSLLLPRRVTLAQAWNVILRWANLCTEYIWVCPPEEQAWMLYGHLLYVRGSCHA